MGPPERPKAEKATDINDLNDLVTAAGVDLRAEENYLAATYRNKHQDSSFSTSFGTSSSSTVSPENSFQQWSQSSYGQYPAFQPNGPFSQPPVSQRSVEDEIREQHKRAARQRAESKQAHLNSPFLLPGPLRQRLDTINLLNQVTLDLKGVTEKPVTASNVHGASMVGADGQGLVAAAVYRTVEADAPLADIMTLLSLACEQRLRGLAEDACAIARGRQYGSHGVVPPEWKDVATGVGAPKATEARSQSVTRTAWDQVPDSAVSPMTVSPPKRESRRPQQQKMGPNGFVGNANDIATRLPTPPTEPDAPLLPTIAYPSALPLLLRDIALADREAEKRRLERRKKRSKDRQSSIVDEVSSPAVGSPATPSADPPKISKKELAKQKGAQMSEDYMHKQANQTAALALGGGSKKYSWMTAAAAPAASTLAAGAGLGRGSIPASRNGSGAVPTLSQEDAALRSKESWKQLGDFREDGPRGRGVQMRDFITVVERDGLEKKTVTKLLLYLSSQDVPR
jgi:hypothetical protein